GQRFHRQRVMQIRMNPCNEVAESIGRRYLVSEWLGKLVLSSWSLQIHNELARNGERRSRTFVFLDECQREIDSRGDAGRRVKLPIADEQCIGVDAQPGKSMLDVLCRSPMCRHIATVEQSSRGE